MYFLLCEHWKVASCTLPNYGFVLNEASRGVTSSLSDDLRCVKNSRFLSYN